MTVGHGFSGRVVFPILIPMTKPLNIILIVSDEFRADCLSCVGNPDIKTPNIDALAARGALLQNHFCPFPKCVPSRVAMMTGRYCHTDGFRTITQHLPDGGPNLLEALKPRGYETACLGINHCWDKGFEGYLNHHSWSGYYEDIYLKHKELGKQKTAHLPPPTEAENRFKRMWEYAGVRHPLWHDDCVAEQAVDFLTKRRCKAKPFFLQVNFSAPHPAYGVEEPYASLYDPDTITAWPHDLPKNAALPFVAQRSVRTGLDAAPEMLRKVQAAYYGMIAKIDELVGSVVAAIDAEGLFENSIVVFTSDHGDFAGQYGLIEKWDTVFSDCLTNVPFIMVAPGISKGTVHKGLTEHTDLTPTFLELIGARAGWGIHGQSLLPYLNGARVKEAVFADGGHEEEMLLRFEKSANEAKEGTAPMSGKQLTYALHPQSLSRAQMVRTETHKLVMRLEGGNELYDLENDPWELDNRYDDPALASVQMDLQRRLIEWQLRTNTDRPYQEVYGA